MKKKAKSEKKVSAAERKQVAQFVAEVCAEAKDQPDVFGEHKVAVVAAFKAHAESAGSVASAVHAAVADGVERADVVQWGVEAGYSEAWVRSVVSSCFVAAGKRVRAVGAGRPVDPKAVTVFEYAAQWGEGPEAVRVLRAACRYAEKQVEAAAKVAVVPAVEVKKAA